MSNKTDKVKIIFSKLFRDKDDKLVLLQIPNLPLVLWLITNLLIFFVNGKLLTLLELISFGLLFTWAWLETFKGVNYFRRILGIIVFIVIISNKLK